MKQSRPQPSIQRWSDYGRYPPIAVLTHASSLDSRHALTDRAVWGFVMIKSLSEALIARVKNAAAGGLPAATRRAAMSADAAKGAAAFPSSRRDQLMGS
jgi:hypothetical protein